MLPFQPLPYDGGAQEPAVPWPGGSQEPVSNLPFPIEPGTPGPGVSSPASGVTQAPGGGGIMDFIQGLFGGGGGNPLGLTSLIPALASAYNMYNNAGAYRDTAERASRMASPVSQETRESYQARLRELYENPTAFLEKNPEFMATRRLGENALFSKNNAMGLGGTGAATADQLTFLSDLGARFVNQERDDLMNMGGFQFSPASGAEMLMRGNDQEIAAKTAALGALMYPFGAGQGPGRGPGSGGPGGGPGGRSGPGSGGPGGGGGGFNINPAQIAQIAGTFGMSPASLFQLLGRFSWGMDPSATAGLINSGLPNTMGWDWSNPSTWAAPDPNNLTGGLGLGDWGLGGSYGSGMDPGLFNLGMDHSYEWWNNDFDPNDVDWSTFDFDSFWG